MYQGVDQGADEGKSWHCFILRLGILQLFVRFSCELSSSRHFLDLSSATSSFQASKGLHTDFLG